MEVSKTWRDVVIMDGLVGANAAVEATKKARVAIFISIS